MGTLSGSTSVSTNALEGNPALSVSSPSSLHSTPSSGAGSVPPSILSAFTPVLKGMSSSARSGRRSTPAGGRSSTSWGAASVPSSPFPPQSRTGSVPALAPSGASETPRTAPLVSRPAATSPPVYETGSVVATVTVGANPNTVGYDSGNGDVYVANWGSSTVSVISGTTVVATVTVGASLYGVAYDSGNGDVYVAIYGSNTVSVISGTTVVTTIPVGTNPDGVGYDSGNGDVYVANYGSNTVSVISGTTVVATVTVGNSPVGVAYDSGNGDVYVANQGSNNVSVISGTAVVATVTVGSEPMGEGYDGGNGDVYVVNSISSTVSVISTELAVGTLTGRVASSAQPEELDVGQTLGLSAPLIFPNPGVSGSPASVSPASGLACTTLPATLTNVSMACTASAAGSYGVTLTVTDTSGNSVWTSTTVTVFPDPSVSVPTPTRASADVGQTVVFSTQATGGPGAYTHYAWSAPSGLGCATFTPNTLTCVPTAPVSSGAVSVNVTDTDNYTSSPATLSYTVSADPTLSALTGAPASLDVGQSTSFSVVATNGTGRPSTYSWSGLPPGCLSANATTLTCKPTVAGTYSVAASIRDSNGFNLSSPSLTLVISPALGAAGLSASRATLDVGQAVSLAATISGGTQSYLYQWAGLPAGCLSTSTPSLACVPSAPGTYLVRVWTNDTNGASATTTVTLTVSADPTITTPTATRMTLDVGQSTVLGFMATNGTGLWSVLSWSGLPSGCTSVNASTLTCAPGVSGTYSVSASITDSNGMSVASGPVTLVVSPALTTPSFTPSRIALDVGQAVLLSATVSGGAGSYTYSWGALPAGCATSNTASLTCVPTSVGSGTFATTLTVTDSNGVTRASSSVTLTVSADPTILITGATYTRLDLGQSTLLTATVANGTGGASTYVWSGLPLGCVSANTLNLTCAPIDVGTYGVTVSITDSNGMTVTSGPLTLSVSSRLSAPTLSSSAQALDVGQSVTLSATVSGGSAPYTYNWTLPQGCASGNTATLACSPTTTGSATVTVTVVDGNGVSLTSTALHLTVSARLSPGSITLVPAVVDLGQATKLTASVSGGSGGLTYIWSGLPSGCTGNDTATLSCTPAASGTSWVAVSVTDSNGEMVSVGPVTLTVSPGLGTPTVSASESSLTLGGSVTFTVSVSGGTAPLTYVWTGLPAGCASTNSAVLTCVPTAKGTFTASVTVTDTTGAHVSASASPVTVKAIPAAAPTGLSNGLDWGILALGIVALVVGLLALLLAFRRKASTTPGSGKEQDRAGSGTEGGKTETAPSKPEPPSSTEGTEPVGTKGWKEDKE